MNIENCKKEYFGSLASLQGMERLIFQNQKLFIFLYRVIAMVIWKAELSLIREMEPPLPTKNLGRNLFLI